LRNEQKEKPQGEIIKTWQRHVKFNKRMKQYFILLLFLFISQIVFAQPEVETTIDSTNMMIGDQMNMEFKVKHAPKMVVLMPKSVSLGDKIEVLSERDTTAKISENEVLTKKSMTITSFDSGIYVIPPVPIQIERNGIIDTIFSKALRLTVVSPFLDTTKNIAPIKDIFTENISFKHDILPVLLGLFAIIILISIIVYYTKRQKQHEAIQQVTVEKPQLPAHVIAYIKLKELDDKQLWQKGDFKKYQSEISYTIREYLENRYEIPALESVTQEIMSSLNGFDIGSKPLINLKNILQTADLVKFAKLIPNENQHREAMDFSLDFVKETLEEEIEEEEK
jgi:hypothetical protein